VGLFSLIDLRATADAIEPQVKRADTSAATDPVSGLLSGLLDGGKNLMKEVNSLRANCILGAINALPSGAVASGDLLAGIANTGLVPRDVEV
jgi:hypothetical protein